MNGADAMVKCLEMEGVKAVFGYPGVAICPFYNSILDSEIESVLVRQSGAELAGMGFLIEKAFQHGGDYLRAQGIHVESLAVIESLEGCRITLKE